MVRWALLGLLPACFGLTARAQQPAPPRGAGRPRSTARLASADEIRKRLGLSPAYNHVRGLESLKIAILDFGFEGLERGRDYLPDNAVVVEHYDPDFVRRF